MRLRIVIDVGGGDVVYAAGAYANYRVTYDDVDRLGEPRLQRASLAETLAGWERP